MTKDYDEIHKKKIVDKSNGIGAIGRIPSDAEIVHAETGGGSSPLYVWYRVPEKE